MFNNDDYLSFLSGIDILKRKFKLLLAMTSKPSIEKIAQNPDHSFSLRKVVREKRPDLSQDGVWHYHEEYELTLTTKSSGKRIVGYNIDDYSSNELILLGPNLPHCWITDHYVEQYVLQFRKETFGDNFWNNAELSHINKLLKDSQHGIKFSADITNQIASLLLSMNVKEGFEMLLTLFNMLNLLTKDPDIQLLTFQDYSIKNSLKASNRIEKIYSYIHENYNASQVSLSDLSNFVNMTPSSLCKFISKITKKTFSELLIETRVKEACKLLQSTDKYISEISYICGFKNLSSFNRNFKKVMKKTPKEYRKVYSAS